MADCGENIRGGYEKSNIGPVETDIHLWVYHLDKRRVLSFKGTFVTPLTILMYIKNGFLVGRW